MKPHRSCIALLIVLGALGATAHAAESLVVDQLTSEAPESLSDALLRGKVSVDARLRYERVRQDFFFPDVDSVNARLRLGYTTKAYSGFQAMVEGEAFNEVFTNELAGLNEDYLINQAWISYTYANTKGTLGRQRLVFDNARFIGDENWRQNDQTFDAIVIRSTSLDKVTATYAYISYVSGVSFHNVPSWTAGDWHSDSHALNVSYAGFPFGTLTAYAYLLDFRAGRSWFFPNDYSARLRSCQTYGLSFAGSLPLMADLAGTYRLEYATQSDYGRNWVSYRANYFLGEFGLVFKTHSVAVGHEVLGNGRIGFQTPLASFHIHNGWADAFAGEMVGSGLTDTYFKYGTRLFQRLDVLAAYHYFGTEKGPSHIGEEIDLMATYRATDTLGFTVKFAKFFQGYDMSLPDRTKVWLQADYIF